MADILTHLRELSVGYAISTKNYHTFNDTPINFLNHCKANIKNCSLLDIDNISSNSSMFNMEELNTINNGIKLAHYLILKNIVDNNSNHNIIWLGNNTQSGTTFDLIIDNIPFSLKEESFILHNMGLYQLLNIITDTTNFKRGLHIFEKFSNTELNNWFNTTRDLIISYLKQQDYQIIDSKNRIARLSYNNDKLFMMFVNESITIDNFSQCTYDIFKKQTNNRIREKVFSKFIKQYLSNNTLYLDIKQQCSINAGINLVNYLKQQLTTNPSPSSLYNLFRIENQSYYYAKTTNNTIEVYKIPSKQNFTNTIKITNISYKVPASQLNFYTTIKNTQTNQELIFRNELRYSHGQLNGTPEAKMYIDKGTLLIAYEAV